MHVSPPSALLLLQFSCLLPASNQANMCWKVMYNRTPAPQAHQQDASSVESLKIHFLMGLLIISPPVLLFQPSPRGSFVSQLA
uniref:Putative secreted protein n=1 Tax=Anopheles darlingi TaxID=43151 RepID=A0A2M4DGC7_ANODA